MACGIEWNNKTPAAWMDRQAGVVPVAVCTGTAAVVSVDFSSLWDSTGPLHRFPGAVSESLTHSVDRFFGNTWPPCATLSLMTDASSVTELFVPPLYRCLRRTITRINNYAGLYRLPGTFYENWKCFHGRLAKPSAQSESYLADS